MKDTLRKYANPPFFQKVIFSLLLVIAPYAATFTAYDRAYADETGTYPIYLDPHYPIRAALIIGGLAAGVLTLALLAWGLVRWCAKKHQGASELILQTSMALCSLYIGWAIFPYWINGVFQAYRGNLPPDMYLSHLDPKSLIPELWMGDAWRQGAMLLSLITILALPVLFVACLASTIKSRAWKREIACLGCLTITAAIFLLSPGYFVWLAD